MSNNRDFANATWVKSSYSAGNGGQCVEFARDVAVSAWRRSSYCGGNGGECLEFNPELTAVVPVRDSKDTTRPPLIFQAPAWSAFIASVKRTAPLA